MHDDREDSVNAVEVVEQFESRLVTTGVRLSAARQEPQDFAKLEGLGQPSLDPIQRMLEPYASTSYACAVHDLG